LLARAECGGVGITDAGIIMAKQSAHALREKELRERVLAAIRRAD